TALAARQQRGQILAWGVGVFALSLPIGSLGRQISDFIDQDPDLAQLLPGGAAAAADGAFALYLVFLVVMAAMYAVGAVISVRSEESSGRAEEALATPVSRTSWLGGQLAVIAGAAVAITVAAGVGMGITAAFTLSDAGALGRLIGAALNTVPAVLVIVGACAAVYGLIPRALPALWAFLGYVLVAGMFGEVLPDRFGVLSPFHYTPALPAESFSATPLAVLLLLAAALFLAAVTGFQRRDVGR
ncbi:anibiotic ABC transporter efflux pump, partial [Rhodococcus wratislaviensis IFP 2016]